MLSERIYRTLNEISSDDGYSSWGVVEDMGGSNDYFGTDEKIQLDGQWLYVYLDGTCGSADDVRGFVDKFSPDHICKMSECVNDYLAFFRL